jgi:hypothetical protein
MFRKAVFASLIALGGAAGGAAQAADEGPYLVNRNGNQEVVYGSRPDNVVGGAFATITGGGDNTTYQAALGGARFEEPRLIGRLSGGGDDEAITYAAPAPRTARLGARG